MCVCDTTIVAWVQNDGERFYACHAHNSDFCIRASWHVVFVFGGFTA
ncbi:hypothetical protein HMPREF3190_01598 [Umbribacter vaginalis]|nr:hypothetical protein HMPREF3190_01598 [Coriobacteriales bacterium DNF00809]